jgi:hypothetical protein
LHLIADNLGWFGDRGDTIERILERRGEAVKRLAATDPEVLELACTPKPK